MSVRRKIVEKYGVYFITLILRKVSRLGDSANTEEPMRK